MNTARRLAFFLLFPLTAIAQTPATDVAAKLDGFDAYMNKTLKDWNAPGVGPAEGRSRSC